MVVYFKVLSQRLPRGTRENYENCQDSWFQGQDSNTEPPEYEAGLLTTCLRHSVVIPEMRSRHYLVEGAHSGTGWGDHIIDEEEQGILRAQVDSLPYEEVELAYCEV